jgi:hypothetical protein
MINASLMRAALAKGPNEFNGFLETTIPRGASVFAGLTPAECPPNEARMSDRTATTNKAEGADGKG